MPLKTPKEGKKTEQGKEEIQEVAVSLAVVKVNSVNAALWPFYQNWDGIFTIKEEQRMALKALLPTDFYTPWHIKAHQGVVTCV